LRGRKSNFVVVQDRKVNIQPTLLHCSCATRICCNRFNY